MKALPARYIDVKEAAQIMRAALKREFVDVKFSVKLERYAGGSSIDVKWTDGPTEDQVNSVVKQFAGARFDGMIDMQTHVKHWLTKDGKIVVARHAGTQAQKGSSEEEMNLPPAPDAELVSFGSDYVFAAREYSAEFLRRAAARVAQKWNITRPNVIERDGYAYIEQNHAQIQGSAYSSVDLVHQLARQTIRTPQGYIYPKN